MCLLQLLIILKGKALYTYVSYQHKNVYNLLFYLITHKNHGTHREVSLTCSITQFKVTDLCTIISKTVKVFIVPSFLILIYRATFVMFANTGINYNLTSKEKYNQKVIPHLNTVF